MITEPIKQKQLTEVNTMIMKFMVQYGSTFDYYTTKEEAITDAINDARLGIRTANFLFKLNEETKEYEKIGEFGRK